jgi:hypothetical protein
MPIYKGSNEVSSGNLRKGSTEIQNGYKQTDQFYVNTLAITINFVDAISGATMNTAQFSSIGTPGASFSSFSRTITTDSGRIFSGTVSVAEAGDSGNNVSASISGQGSTTATLNVSGTYPTQGVTVTLTVNGATQVQLPNLVVTQNGNYPLTTTGDGGAIGTYNYSISNSADCVGGSSGSGSTSGSGSSNTYYGYSRPGLAGGPYGNGCGMTCNSSFTSSKSGYNNGATTFSETVAYPTVMQSCAWNPSSNPSGASYTNPLTGGVQCPSCVTCSPGSLPTNVALSASSGTASQGGACFGNVGAPSVTYFGGIVSCTGSTITSAIPAYTTNWPQGTGLSTSGGTIDGSGSYITGISGVQNFNYPVVNSVGMKYQVSAVCASGTGCNSTFDAGLAGPASKSFSITCNGGSGMTGPCTVTTRTFSQNVSGALGDFGTNSHSVS